MERIFSLSALSYQVCSRFVAGQCAEALAIGGLFAGFMAVSDRLERMEQKLDKLSQRPEGSEEENRPGE